MAILFSVLFVVFNLMCGAGGGILLHYDLEYRLFFSVAKGKESYYGKYHK
jgi:hypothetical protein